MNCSNASIPCSHGIRTGRGLPESLALALRFLTGQRRHHHQEREDQEGRCLRLGCHRAQCCHRWCQHQHLDCFRQEDRLQVDSRHRHHQDDRRHRKDQCRDKQWGGSATTTAAGQLEKLFRGRELLHISVSTLITRETFLQECLRLVGGLRQMIVFSLAL